jgi:YidC/Oxa1 family membrane protein insertase
MDRNTLIGFLLIFGLLVAMQLVMAPEQKKLEAERQARLDSLRQVEQLRADSLQQISQVGLADSTTTQDSQSLALQQQRYTTEFGPFAPAAVGQEKAEVLENDLMRVIFTNKGGRVKEVELKQHFKVVLDSSHKEIKLPLKLLEDDKNRFEYLLPVAGLPNKLSSEKLFFQPMRQGDNAVAFRADAGQGRYFEQVYTLVPGSYALKYEIRFHEMGSVLDQKEQTVQLRWLDYLDKLEQNHQYERNYSTVYYKLTEDGYDYCSCTDNDEVDQLKDNVKWVAHSNQFFASVLIAGEKPFKGAKFTTEMLDPTDKDLKRLSSEIQIPLEGQDAFAMELFLGPKDFETLRAYGESLEDIIPFGSSFIGTANRWVIRPLFNFLMSFIGIKGIVILVLTLLVKLLLYPLSYKMLYSQAKMAALKPQLTVLREKYQDDQTQLQMESMKIYREFGVNPLGGCLPIVLQMPVWLALYRFFPASIEFRQANFLWASDLSSYDVFVWLPFEIPFYGAHVSLFTLLWVVTTILYTHYNMAQMDMASMGGGANAQLMKWMQYLMPVFFLFFFNNFASGLTCYLVFSNILNVAQTVITKRFVIDNDKILEQLEAYRKKPKKKGGFQARLEEALKQQQAVATQREATEKGKRKK